MKATADSASNARPTKPLTDWRLYAAAAGAALAAGSSADAAIITGNANVDVKLPGAAPYNTFGKVTQKFQVGTVALTAAIQRGHTFNAAYFRAAQNRIITSGGLAKRFAKNSAIAGGVNTFAELRTHQPGSAPNGAFVSGQIGYAGIANGAAKGWLNVQVIDRNNDGYPDELKILNYAYNNAGGINAGQTSAPEPSGLALLALGSAGVLAWRRRRPQVK